MIFNSRRLPDVTYRSSIKCESSYPTISPPAVVPQHVGTNPNLRQCLNPPQHLSSISDVTLSEHGRVMNINKHSFSQFLLSLSIQSIPFRNTGLHCQSYFTVKTTTVAHIKP